MFSKGTRVQVVNEKEARRTAAQVYKGQKGTVTSMHYGGYAHVVTDEDSSKGIEIPWSIPVGGLRRIHCKKVSV